MGENINDRLEQSFHGQPELNIDEHKQYLGSLRERIFVRLTVEQMQNKVTINQFLRHFNDYSGYQILINGKLPQSTLQNLIIMNASKRNIPFRIINDETAKQDNDATGLLVIAQNAIKCQQIEFNLKYQD